MKLAKCVRMMMIVPLALSCSKGITSKAADTCNVPERIVSQLRGSAAYHNRDQTAPRDKESFSVIRLGQRWFFRDNNPQDSDSQGLRPVSTYEDSRWWSGVDLQCPADASWVKCAAAWNPYSFLPPTSPLAQLKEHKPEAVTVPPCDFEVPVPRWLPTPDTEEKKRVAAELSQEVLQNQNPESKVKAVYVRDFNLNDPIIDILVEDSSAGYARWYEFYSENKPHLSGGSGGYGTVTLESTRNWIMELPYRLYPPPIGKP